MVNLVERLKKALQRARLDFREIVQKAKLGEVQFHEVKGAVAITALSSSGEYRTCEVVAVAGTLSAMPEIEAKVEAFARANGCQCIEASARPGWSRIAPPAPGYEVVAVKYRKKLEV